MLIRSRALENPCSEVAEVKLRLKPNGYMRGVLVRGMGGLLAVLAFLFFPSNVTYRVEERYVIASGASEAEVFLAVFQPKTGPYQWVSDAIATHEPAWKGHNVSGNEYINVVANSVTLPPGQTAVLESSYRVEIKRGKAEWQGEYLPQHLREEKNIEVLEPLIQQEAEKLKANAQGSLAQSIYVYVAELLSWPTGSRVNVEPSAVEALQSRVGGCAEFANLTTALSRAVDIPAVTISGLAMPELVPFMYKKSTWGHPAGAHAWVELYTGDKWVMADPSWAGNLRQKAYYGRNDGRHLSFGPDVEERAVFSRVEDWAKTNGPLIGAMYAPNKFVASASATDVTITPAVTVTKGLDSRHIAALVSVVAGSLAAWLITRKNVR